MSFNCVHFNAKQMGDETFGLSVYVDESACFSIVYNGQIQSMRSLDPNEDGSDIAIVGESREWFVQQLAIGRTKAKGADPWAEISPFCPTGKHALTWGGTPEKPNYYGCDCVVCP